MGIVSVAAKGKAAENAGDEGFPGIRGVVFKREITIMEKETWKPVVGYEEKYEVSDLGRVKNSRGSIKKSFSNGNGYLSVGLSIGGVRKTKKVHKLVAMAFLGHTPSGFKEVINHINHDRHDNRLLNLEIVTVRENNSKRKNQGVSKYVGVYFEPERGFWRSCICVNGKTEHLGRYRSEIDASAAYQKRLSEILP